MANPLLAGWPRRDGPGTGRQREAPAFPKTAGHFSFREKPGQVMMKGAKEERISDVVAIAYSVLALLLMLAWTYVPA